MAPDSPLALLPGSSFGRERALASAEAKGQVTVDEEGLVFIKGMPAVISAASQSQVDAAEAKRARRAARGW